MSATFAFAVGIRNTNGAGLVLDCLYPSPVMNPDGAVADAIATLPEGVSTLNDKTIETLQSAAPSLVPQPLLANHRDHSPDQALVSVRQLLTTTSALKRPI